MMTVPVMYLFLQFIPETLAVISLNILLFSYSLKKYFPRILLAAILHSILIFVIWQLEIPQELRIVINSLIFGLTNWAVFRFAVLQVVAMSVIGLFTLFVTEYLSIIIAANFIFNVDPDVLIASPQYRTYIPYVHISVLVVLAYWFYRLKYRIKRPDLTGRKRYTGLLFIIGLIQIFFLLLLVETLTMYGTVDLFSVHRVPLHIMIVILMVVLSFVIIKKWYQYEVGKVLGIAENTYENQLKSLLTSIRSQRHDMNNHLQVIYGFMKINEFEKARDYLKKIVEDIDYVNISLKIPNQSLTVLLHSKCMIAQSKRIQLSLDVHEDEFDQIVPTDLIRILSNLIDNAFDAALLMPVKQRKVDIKLHRKSDAYVFEIANSGPTISKQDQEKLFESGFSTKNESNAGRGYGLTIVKQLVSVYQGRIEITSENRWTVFRVVTPLAKEHRT